MRTILALLALAGAAVAQEAKPAPAGAPEAVEATLVSFKGTVDVKRPEDKDWVAAERNMKLKKGSEICTAVASSAVLLFTGNVKVEMKALSQAKIEELVKQGTKLNADVKLKFGTLEVDIQKGDLRADMKVSAPNSTTSVSGSHGIVRAFASKDGGDTFISLKTFSGTWTFEDPAGMLKDLQGAGQANEGGTLSKDMFQIFLIDLYLDFGGRTETELNKDSFNIKGGETYPGGIPLYEFGGTGPVSPKHLKPAALPLPPPPPPQP